VENMAGETVIDHQMDLRNILRDLVGDGLLAQEDANMISGSQRNKEQSLLHPFAYIAGQRPQNASDPGKQLGIDDLTQWLSEKSDLEIVHIDPLKVDVTAVTDVMSFKFARRHSILCVDASGAEVGLPPTPPIPSSWVADYEQTRRKPI
jgi:general secretion pathway protein E